MCDKHPLTVGGVEEHVRGLARQLVARGFEVLVAYRRESSRLLHGIELSTVRADLDLFKLKKLIKCVGPDLVHAHYSFNWLPLLAVVAADQLGVASVVTSHSVLPGYDQGGLSHLFSLTPHRPLLSKARALISVSKAVDLLMSRMAGPRVRRSVIPNAVDTDKYAPSAEASLEPLVLYVGRLVYRKGVHVLLHAFKEVVREEGDARLVVVGGGYLAPFLKTLASKLGLDGKVVFKGVVSEESKASLYREAWVVAVPTLYAEGFGIVAAEAMASGAPVVASRVGGLKEVVEHEATGLLVKPNSPRELSMALTSLIQDRSLRRRLSAKARARALEAYSWNEVAERIVNTYLSLN